MPHSSSNTLFLYSPEQGGHHYSILQLGLIYRNVFLKEPEMLEGVIERKKNKRTLPCVLFCFWFLQVAEERGDHVGQNG